MSRYFLLILALVFVACNNYDHGGERIDGNYVIPATLVGIQAVNVDNEGQWPKVSDEPVKKEAYMIGVKWVSEHIADPNGYISDGYEEYWRHCHGHLGSNYRKRVVSLNDFDAKNPAGSNVSDFFREIDRDYLPENVDEGLVLLVTPQPGVHRFRVEYYLYDELKFAHETTAVELF